MFQKIKYAIQKFINNKKADAKALTNATYAVVDIKTDGLLTTAKTLLTDTYKSYQETRFNNLILDVVTNNTNKDELFSFINSSSEKDREFLCSVVLKNIHADNRLTTFILAKLWASRIQNGKLNYYESSLFTNINSFTVEDFEGFYDIWKNKKKTKYDTYYFDIQHGKEYYLDVQNKLFNMGIIEKPTGLFGTPAQERKMYAFDSTGFSEYLFELLKEYFEASK
jgi:hypothetical protein